MQRGARALRELLRNTGGADAQPFSVAGLSSVSGLADETNFPGSKRGPLDGLSQAEKSFRRGLVTRLNDLRVQRSPSWAEVHVVFFELRRRDLLRYPKDYSTASAALAKVQMWQEALNLLTILPEHFDKEARLFIHNITLTAMDSAHQWQLSLALLDDVRKKQLGSDISAVNSVMGTLQKVSLWSRTLEMWNEVTAKEGFTPTVESYNTLLSTLQQVRYWQRAVEVLEVMRQKQVLDSVSFVYSIRAWGDAMHWQQALNLLVQSRLVQIPLSVSTYTAAIGACGSGQRWTVSLALLEEMRTERLTPLDMTMTSVMKACSKGRKLHAAVDIFRDIQNTNITPDRAMLTSLIAACAPSAQWTSALALLKAMGQGALSPDAAAFSAVISVLAEVGRWRESLEILKGVESLQLHLPPNAFDAAVSVCSSNLQWQHGLRLLQLFGKEDPEKEQSELLAILHGVVARACQEAGQPQLAAELHEVGRGLDPPLIEWVASLHWEMALTELAKAKARGAVDWTLRGTCALVLLESGRDADAMTLYLEAREAGELAPWQEDGAFDFHRVGVCPEHLAELMVKAELLQLGAEFGFGREAAPDFLIITGRGKGSLEGLPVIMPSLLKMLQEHLGLDAFQVPNFQGRILVPGKELRRFWSGS